ncbi:hypothetical protein [Streptoalloteichus hindustanus]|uniref:Uncharacterized protein n=1 Tax=Streptoalloteichus hindustanus TaxID=2017 RepID=A0A1M5IXD5_STRHI|nr:hypothetical protein [Streptoalloteichus hindustanus]SHG32931.1 hypothetical protein SAMN05444320_10842 [Streptoalloteichus hindustanus]
MTQFELIFAVDGLAEGAVWAIYEDFDALVATHGTTTLLTVTTPGPTAPMAAKAVVAKLEKTARVVVQRCYEDLVNRVDIAERCRTTPQAVGQWIHGKRRREVPFPEPFNLVNGGVWLWGEVNEWLRRSGKPSDDVQFPCRADYYEINHWLNERRTQRRLSAVNAQPVRSSKLPPAHLGRSRRVEARNFWGQATDDARAAR